NLVPLGNPVLAKTDPVLRRSDNCVDFVKRWQLFPTNNWPVRLGVNGIVSAFSGEHRLACLRHRPIDVHLSCVRIRAICNPTDEEVEHWRSVFRPQEPDWSTLL